MTDMNKFIFDLQRFADGDMGNVYNDSSIYATGATSPGVNTQTIAAPYTGTSGTALAGLTPEMKEFYSKNLIYLVGPNLVWMQFGEAESLPKGHGRTIEWRRWGKFRKALTPLVEGKTPPPSLIEVTPVRKTLNQYGDWTPYTDLLKLNIIDNAIVEMTAKHSENARLTLDTVIREEVIAGVDQSHEVFAGGVDIMAKLSGKITGKDIARVATYLKNNNAPKFGGAYVAIVHPSVVFDLMTDDKWIDVNKYSNATAIFNGEVGKLYGVRFVESTEAKAVASKFGSGTAATSSATVVSYSGAESTYVITVGENILKTDDFKSGDKIYIHDVSATDLTVEELTVSAINATNKTITLASAPTVTPAAGDILYMSDAPVDGKTLYTCVFLGKGAYKYVKLDGNTMEVIVKPLGSGDDPLEQRGSVGWKNNGFGAQVVIPEYIFKYYCVSDIDVESN